jgi:hypothetical protein
MKGFAFMEITQVSEQHAERNIFAAFVPVIQSALLLFCTLFPLNFLHLIFHEGGHALVDIANGGKVDLFYVHPFALNGYVRPIMEMWNIGMHVAGGISGMAVGLGVFLFVWKHRSVSVLPLVMLFPWTALVLGPQIMLVVGDWRNLVILTGIPEVILNITGGLIVLVGLFLFISLFPLLGLVPENKRSLLVVPAAVVLWSVVGIIVGYLFVPGSPVDVKYRLAEEIMIMAKSFPVITAVVGVLLAGIYVTLYRLVYRRLPAGFRTETALITWRDLRIPGLLAMVCVILGLWIIR